MTIWYILIMAIFMWKSTWRKYANRSCQCDPCIKGQPIILFSAKFANDQFDEASSYQTKQFKVHVAVKEMINLRDEMDTIITQKYKKDQAMPEKKRKD